MGENPQRKALEHPREKYSKGAISQGRRWLRLLPVAGSWLLAHSAEQMGLAAATPRSEGENGEEISPRKGFGVLQSSTDWGRSGWKGNLTFSALTRAQEATPLDERLCTNNPWVKHTEKAKQENDAFTKERHAYVQAQGFASHPSLKAPIAAQRVKGASRRRWLRVAAASWSAAQRACTRWDLWNKMLWVFFDCPLFSLLLSFSCLPFRSPTAPGDVRQADLKEARGSESAATALWEHCGAVALAFCHQARTKARRHTPLPLRTPQQHCSSRSTLCDPLCGNAVEAAPLSLFSLPVYVPAWF